MNARMVVVALVGMLGAGELKILASSRQLTGEL